MVMVATYKVARRTLYNGVWREDGLIPEANTFFLIDNLVHTGYLDEVQVEETEFRAAVAKLPNDQQEQVIINAGLHPDFDLEGARGTPFRRRFTATLEPLKKEVTVEKVSVAKVSAKKAPAKAAPQKAAPAKHTSVKESLAKATPANKAPPKKAP